MLRHLKAKFPIIAGLCLLLVGIFVGERWGLYYSIPYLDKILHVLGGLISAWLVMAFIQDDIGRIPWFKQLIIVVAITGLIGLLWEFAEYGANFTRQSLPGFYHYFHGGDLGDTLGDLVADLSGGLIFTAWALYKERD